MTCIGKKKKKSTNGQVDIDNSCMWGGMDPVWPRTDLNTHEKHLCKLLPSFRFTLPNMVCLLLSSSARPRVKKNWLPLSCGPAFAMATKPLRLKRNLEWNSSYRFRKKQVFHGEFLRKMISTSATFSSCSGDKFVNTSYKWFTLMILLKEIKKRSDLEWPAIDGLSTFPCSSGISPLNNEVTHHSVKHCAIVVTLRIERYQTIR